MKKLFFGLLFVASFCGFSQNIDKEVLFSIDGKPYYTTEFVKVYNKNLDLVKDESQKDLDAYLELFLGYKLKVSKANKLGLQNGTQYQTELKTYRGQLAKNYTTDKKVTKELVDEGFERSKKEVNASHILILCDENAAPADTLIAYNKALDLRKKIISGADFGETAKEFSQDPSAKDNKGNLGYFSAFRMVYPFETAAYKTKLGEISMPTRTRFGFHLVKVVNVRDNRGEITVAHIMVLDGKDPESQAKQKSKIDDIYKKIVQGEKFEDLAREFSEDKSSSDKGGVMNRFGSGQLSSEEFETAAFGLTKEKPMTEPIKSQYGWHIIKLIEKYPLKTFEESKSDLEGKVSKDDRSRLIANTLTEKLRKKYVIKRDEKVFADASKFVNDTFYEGKWVVPTDKKVSKLFSVEKKAISDNDFLEFVNKQQKTGIAVKPIQKVVDLCYKKFVDEQLNTYYNDNLEGEFPEFASVVEEYRDGLLLFDLMEKEIWQRSKSDTLGLKKFFETQKDKFVWKKRANASIFSSTKKETILKVAELLKQNIKTEDIKSQINTKDAVNVMVSEGKFEEGNDALPKDTKLVVGVSEISQKGDYFYLTKISEVLPAGNKTLEECKGKVVNDYQQYLEQNWVSELKKEFKIDINKPVFEKIKKQIKK